MAATSSDRLSDAYLGRRYSGILIADPAARTMQQIADLVQLRNVQQLSFPGLRSAWKADFMFSRSLYPFSLAQRNESGGFNHRVYLMQNSGYTMVVAPYVRLLESMRVLMGPDAAALQFGRLRVQEAFRCFTVSSPGGAHVSQIVMGSTSGVDQVDYVSLAGKNPLRSRMHERLTDPGASPVRDDHNNTVRFVPHGLTLRAPGGRTALALHADGLGNFHFYMTAEERLVELSRLIETLSSSGLVGRRVGWPPRAVKFDDQGEADT